MSIHGDYLTLPHGQLHYRSNTAREATPLILLHQTPSDSRMYLELMAELDADYWMIAPDNPGFGSSASLPDGFDLAGCAGVLLDFLRKLDIERCYLLGHHTGASIAVQIATEAPDLVEKLVLGGPTLLSEELKLALPGKSRPFPPAADGAHLQSMWQRINGKEGDLPPALVLRETLAALAAGDNYPQAYAAVIEQDFSAQLAALECATLVFAGTGDILYPQLEASFELLARGTLAEIDGAGGYVCDLQPQRVAALVRDFLADE